MWESFLHKIVPIFLEHLLLVELISVHDVCQLLLNESIHVSDWSELERDLGLLLADLFESLHDATKGVDFFDGLLDLQLDLLDLVGELLEQGLCLLMDVLAVDIFPVVGPPLKCLFHIGCFERKGTDLMCLLDLVDLRHEGVKFFELVLVVFKARGSLCEDLELLVGILVPEPAVLAKAIKESVDIILGSLD